MKTILIAGHDLKFLSHIREYLESIKDLTVLIDQWENHAIHDETKSLDLLNKADIIFCEWGLGNAVWYSSHKKPGQKLIVRMHLQEKDTPFPKRFTVEKIDRICTITPYWYEEFHRLFGFPRKKMRMIYNTVDTQTFDLPKKTGAEFNLGLLGLVPQRKRLDRALDILEMLHPKDRRYKLFIKGKRPEEYEWMKDREREMVYYDAQYRRIKDAPWRDNVIFDPHGNDIPEWFTKIGWTLSVSDFEGSHQSPSEGMAAGTVPVLIDWKGAETVYPREFIFAGTAPMADFIHGNHALVGAERLKAYARKHFDKQVICDKVAHLLIGLGSN